MANEVVIKISGDVKAYTEALNKTQAQTENLASALGSIGKTAGIAFAALTAEIGLSVKAFYDGETATNALTLAMQNQGIYSDTLLQSYKDMADAVQKKTGLDDDAVVTAQATLQAMIGQRQITQELTMSIADLAEAKQMDLNTTAQLIGKAINGQTTALKKLGIEIDDGLTKNERMIQIQERVAAKYEGTAESANKSQGGMRGLMSAVGDLQKALGERFAPVISAVIGKITEFIGSVANNKPLLDLIASVVAAGAVVTGLAAVVSAGGLAFLKLKAALEAAKIATTAMKVATMGLMGATGIGLLVVLITEIALNWNSVWPRMQATFTAFVNNIGSLGAALGKILKGVFTLDLSGIKAGIAEAKEAVARGLDEYGDIVVQKMAENETKEKAQEDAKRARNREAQVDYREQEAEERAIAFEAVLAQNEEFQAMSEEQQAAFREIRAAQLQEQVLTETTAQQEVTRMALDEQIKRNNRYLIEQQKFGTAYAVINRVINSDQVQGIKQASGEMIAMQQSQHNALKNIGKAAAVANIIIKTAESAMAIYAGFSTIPIVGPALGIAGAAAAIAFGREQIMKVTAAKEGGLITGGVRGIDSVPVLAQHGELVSPAQNFDEVIGSVRAAREAERVREETGTVGGGQVQVMIGFDGREASQVLTARQNEDRRLGVSPEAAA